MTRGNALFGQFCLGLPRDPEEAAIVYGTSYWRVSWNIVSSLSRVISLEMALIFFLASLNPLLWPLTITTDSNPPMVPIGIASFPQQYSGPQMFLNEDAYSIVLRTADELTGPWSEERTVVSGTDFPQLVAPFIPPTWNDGPEISITMALIGPYNVYPMQTSQTANMTP